MRIKRLRRGFLPLLTFSIVFIAHYVWSGIFPEKDTVQSEWLTFPASAGWWEGYIKSQGYYLGFSYALSLAFAFTALRRYREQSSCSSRNIAFGGVTFSGGLAALGCFIIGCCGSPMFAIYLNLFGASFLPLAKPLLASFTAVTIGIAWWAMNKSAFHQTPISSSEKDSCNCGG